MKIATFLKIGDVLFATKVLSPDSKSKIVTLPLPNDDPKMRRPDITLARRLIDYNPSVPLEKGLLNTIEYFKNLLKL